MVEVAQKQGQALQQIFSTADCQNCDNCKQHKQYLGVCQPQTAGNMSFWEKPSSTHMPYAVLPTPVLIHRHDNNDTFKGIGCCCTSIAVTGSCIHTRLQWHAPFPNVVQQRTANPSEHYGCWCLHRSVQQLCLPNMGSVSVCVCGQRARKLTIVCTISTAIGPAIKATGRALSR